MSLCVSVFSTCTRSTILFSWDLFAACTVLYQETLGSAEHPGSYKSKSPSTESVQPGNANKVQSGENSCLVKSQFSSPAEYPSLLAIFQGWRHSPGATMIYDCWTAPWSLWHPVRTALGSLKSRDLKQPILWELEQMKPGLLCEFLS